MRLIISPAKKMRVEPDFLPPDRLPAFLEETGQILRYLQSLSFEALKKLLACNESIARQNHGRYQGMDLEAAETPALLAYDGIQFQYMAPQLFTREQFAYVQKHLRILSGFYGILRPFDAVAPYRLEMQAKLKTPFCSNLYDFWGGEMACALEQEDDIIVNLASEEYAKAVYPYFGRQVRYLTCVFAELEGKKLVEKGVYVKMARGEMVRWLAERGAEEPEQMKEFSGLGYQYVEELSKPDRYVFLKKSNKEERKRVSF